MNLAAATSGLVYSAKSQKPKRYSQKRSSKIMTQLTDLVPTFDQIAKSWHKGLAHLYYCLAASSLPWRRMTNF